MARASAFQAEGRGFESRLPLHFFPIRTWVPQDSNDGQDGASLPCTNLHYPYFFLFELGFPKIRMTGRMELFCSYSNLGSPRFELRRACSPATIYTLPIRLLVPVRTWVPQDSNDGQGGALLFLFELGFPKIRITAGLLPCNNLYSSYSTTCSCSNLGSPRFE